MAEMNTNVEQLDKPRFERGFKDIHSETNITVKEAKDFLTSLFDDKNVNDTDEEKQLKEVNDDVKNTNDDISENKDKKGGSYREVFKEGEGEKYEVHHMPADSTTELSRDDGPAIKMEKEDHRKTASCGNSKEAREYREKQSELIKQGKFREAIQMDIDDIRDKFGDKYDEAISEMLEYVDKLETEGKI
ncbi:hypothetical protein V7087_00105 [Neobacillus niacini]|uniref:hypothetical protein n=1 Tax=Neobacillus niacini TaxID=86668 RepID=UPI002FFDCCD5